MSSIWLLRERSRARRNFYAKGRASRNREIRDFREEIKRLSAESQRLQQLGAGIEEERDRLMENAVCAEPWQIKAAKWLEDVADTQDAEGLTDLREIEIARKLAGVLRTEATQNAKEHDDDNDIA